MSLKILEDCPEKKIRPNKMFEVQETALIAQRGPARLNYRHVLLPPHFVSSPDDVCRNIPPIHLQFHSQTVTIIIHLFGEAFISESRKMMAMDMSD